MPGSKSSDRSSADAALEPLGPGDHPVGLTIHGLPEPKVDERRRTRIGRWKLLMVLLVCASPVIASYFTYFVIRPDGRTNYSTLIEPSRAMPDLMLRDLDGRSYALRDLRDQWLLVVVGSAACDKACEDRLYLQRQLREMTGRERERVEKLWLITDDGPVSPALAEALRESPAMHIGRVDAQALAQWLQPQPGSALEDHVYIVDPMGQWMMRAPPQPEPPRLKRDLERLLRASSFWDRPAGR